MATIDTCAVATAAGIPLAALASLRVELLVLAAYVWGSETDAQAFLHAPHPMLEGQTPLDVALTEPGVRRVETLLWQLFYGVTA